MRDPFLRKPTEILHHIIRLAVPPLRFSTYKERYSVLKACALVSKRWCIVARQELGKHIYIENQGDMDAMLVALDASNGLGATLGGELRKQVRSLRLGDRELWKRSEVKILLYCMPLASELWLSGYIASVLGLRIESWCFVDVLTRLHLNTVTVLPPFAPLPNVEALSIADPPDLTLALHFLRQTALPRLKELGIAYWPQFDYGGGDGEKLLAGTALGRLAPQLESLVIRSQLDHLEGLTLFWSSLSSLRRAYLGVNSCSASPALMAIPSKLDSLRLEPYGPIVHGHWDHGEQLLKDSPFCLQALRKLELPTCEDDGRKGRVDRLCAARGVVLEYQAEVKAPFLAQWEDAMTCSAL
ncbi:hypothetical protein BCR35DRAFT_329569 [Leucosporidium creatinivorum]|uniref:F-box domain-containing protein n=1 Tax=Leucosporidium creatinivorum TaxID=106004 RepID=A0A1Y2G0X5_9BASI|nr:hypothetical protein BCR35DRAFT_329569 [Leucosporidium creatinivorum]